MIGCENRWGRYCLDDQAIEKACKTMVLAYSTGKPLNVLSHQIALITAKSWDDYAGAANAHFEQLKGILDTQEPDYKE